MLTHINTEEVDRVRWTGGRAGRQMDGRADGRTDGRVGGRKRGRTDARTDARTHGCKDAQAHARARKWRRTRTRLLHARKPRCSAVLRQSRSSSGGATQTFDFVQNRQGPVGNRPRDVRPSRRRSLRLRCSSGCSSAVVHARTHSRTHERTAVVRAVTHARTRARAHACTHVAAVCALGHTLMPPLISERLSRPPLGGGPVLCLH